jgi:hypothetical protein
MPRTLSAFATLLWTLPLAAVPTLKVRARVDPARGTLQVTCSVTGWPKGEPIYLNHQLSVDQLVADGQVLACAYDEAAEPLPFTDLSRPLVVQGSLGSSFEISYHGSLAQPIDDVNLITPGLVELAIYAIWYPVARRPEPRTFHYELNLTLPEDFVTVTNGEPAGEHCEAGLRTTTWRSGPEVSDMALVAAPGFKRLRRTQGALGIETFYARMPEAVLAQEADALARGYAALEARLGQPESGGAMRFVYSPRNGWGYSRLPMAVVSEDFVRSQVAKGTYSPAESFRGGIHEAAHFWWHVADTNREDWLNEGLAEYSAVRMTILLFGQPQRKALLAAFLQHASRCRDKVSILGTTFRHDDRYVNHYEKTSLLLAVLEQRHGAEAMDAFLKDIHQAFKGTRGATTAAVLTLAEKRFGHASRTFLEEALNAVAFPLEAVGRELDLPLPAQRQG